MTETVWTGAPEIAEMLVPVESLVRHPRNPRRGQVSLIAESLQRFGQVRPILTDGTQIIAGNHTYLAAVELGWTHIAAVRNEFASDEEARAYLLADNRLTELGSYEHDLLLAQLEELDRVGGWAGTGYGTDDLDALRAMQVAAAAPAPGGPEDPTGTPWVPGAAANTTEMVLLVPDSMVEEFEMHLRILQKEYGANVGLTETVYRATAAAASRT